MSDEAGFVYFIQSGHTNRYKIGLTNNLERRLKELNGSQAAYPLNLVWAIVADDMRSSEYALHQAFQQHRVHGEWFEFEDRDLPRVKAAFYEHVSHAYEQPHFSEERAQPTYTHAADRVYAGDSNGVGAILGAVSLAFFAWFLVMATSGKMSPKLPSLPKLSIAAQSSAHRAIVKTRVNIRQAATTNSKILGQLEPGTQVTYTRQKDGWCYLPDRDGWVAGNYLKID